MIRVRHVHERPQARVSHDANRSSGAMAGLNGERHLNPLLDSLRRQTRPPAELMVHEDASEPQMEDYRGSAELARFAAGAEHYSRLERRWALRIDLNKSPQRRA